MNILYIDHYAGSLEMGMEFRPYYLAKEWIKQGHRVRILGASYSHLRTKNPIIKNDFEKQIIDGVEYQWVETGRYHGNGIARAMTMFQFTYKVYSYSKKIVNDFSPNVVITSSTYPLDTYAGQKIASLANAKLIHENHDLWPLTLETIGGMSKYHPFCILLGCALKSAIKNSNHIVCVLPYANEYFQKYGLEDSKKFTHIPNGVALDDWQYVQELPTEHRELFLKLKDKTIIGYVGGHAVSNALDTFIECSKNFDEKVAFVLVGKGIEKKALIEKVKTLRVNNVFFLPPVSKKQIPAILAEMTAVYVGSKKSELLKYGASLNKLYDYMMAAKPIIYGVDSRNKEVIDANCGYVVEPESVSSLSEAIGNIVNDTKILSEMGNSGRKWVIENCEYSALANKFLNCIK